MDDTVVATQRRLRPLLLGEDRGATRRTLILASFYVAVPAVLEYLYLPPGGDVAVVGDLLHAFALVPDLTAISYGAYGVLTVVGLAGIAAALNEGLLPSAVLATAPVYGSHVWVIAGAPRSPRLVFDPVGAVGRASPEALLFATVGFVLGLGARRLTARLRGRRNNVVVS